ncbi:SRPBCC domain-containing protein [Methanoculleus sp. FWC-SCC1]|uniref:SRPBCC domain-containing protein n=1 Tax=Methanoculleus frigidifontis TaxID=2584085 RepID=A0ABT8MAM6_9EURY|nr:SRPBCC domain-containing protein [Methanoculleus sp. FWC-SCC1]MDN7024988.1 SRPBCC domain-containing protein [Methanoculleus sp. FWC-SCC1]
MKEILSDIIITASPDDVWEILTDFPAYPEWNPFVRSIRGAPKAGERLEVHLRPPGRREMVSRPKVIRALKGRELRWTGRLLVAGLFDGEHRFTIEPLADGQVRFVQAEVFSGFLVPLLPGAIADTERGFAAMNRALKERAERVEEHRRAEKEPKQVPAPY